MRLLFLFCITLLVGGVLSFTLGTAVTASSAGTSTMYGAGLARMTQTKPAALPRTTRTRPGASDLGIHFTRILVPRGRRPLLPNGSYGLSKRQALLASIGDGWWGPDVRITARYGLFTDSELGPAAPNGGTLHPYYQNVPVWLVRYSGAGVKITSDEVKPGTDQPTAMNHELNVAIDAVSGKPLEWYTYR
jgi:hypothetical protein